MAGLRGALGRAGRGAGGALLLLAALLALALSAALAMRPDPRDGLRAADGLFAAGRFHDALAAYRRAASESPRLGAAQARLGMVLTVRGDAPAAQAALAGALGMPLSEEDYALARLYQGALADRAPAYGDAEQSWSLIPAGSPLAGQRALLLGDRLLRRGAYGQAEAQLRAALAAGLPARWAEAAHLRLALLRASSDPQAALGELAAGTEAGRPERPADLLAGPLLPPDDGLGPALRAALAAEGDARAQLLGQLYLDRGLYPLAAARFASVDPGGPQALTAAAYAAYTRWVAGDRAGGMEALRALVEAHPDEPRARALLALAALGSADERTARSELERLVARAPGDPATHLAWGQWYVSQRDYAAAAGSFRRAADRAPAAERGAYELRLARFHLDSDLDVCGAGLGAAQEAAASQPPPAAALAALAQARLACGDPRGALEAAGRASALAPASPEAWYYLGRARAAAGDPAGARQALVAAADAAPGTPWQQRAEDQLALLGG